jgi:3-deoxy-7-phosphoheptulonate synthase
MSVRIGDLEIGGNKITIMTKFNVIENEKILIATARRVRAYGATVLCGGSFKSKFSSCSFQGLSTEGLKIMKNIQNITGLKLVAEVLDIRDVELVASYVDIIQIGTQYIFSNYQPFLNCCTMSSFE